MVKKFNLIVAICENNNGIGINGTLPWKLKNELKYFSYMTKRVMNPHKKNAVIMGRKTYFGIPENRRPLPDRLNIILTKTLSSNDLPPNKDVILCKSLPDAMELLQNDDNFKDSIENIWIIGGSSVYTEALKSSCCHRLYLTKIKTHFDCDTYFPNVPDDFKLIENNDLNYDADVPNGIQEENDVKYEYKIYEKQHNNDEGDH